jgi:cell division protein FtsB
MIKKVLDFFDKFEDHMRGTLSNYPITYTLIGSTCIVLFWRGVWQTADYLMKKGGILGFIFNEGISLVIVTLILLATGLFVSYFIGDAILISGLKQQKKRTEKTKKDIEDEEEEIRALRSTIKEMKVEVDEIREMVRSINFSNKNGSEIGN